MGILVSGFLLLNDIMTDSDYSNPNLRMLNNIAIICGLAMFVAGFFYIGVWQPFVAVCIAPAVITAMLKGSDIVLLPQAMIIVGIPLSIISIFI